MSSVATIVASLKQKGQDFEWYPTTKEIIEAMYWDIKSHKASLYYGDSAVSKEVRERKYDYQSISLLDIGAGDCKVYNTLKEISKAQYIEKECFDEPYSDGRMRYMSKEDKTVNQLGINKYMVIEKSQILIDRMPPEALVVGTDFYENTLIDKKADVIFCNPPYSDYARWTARIIKEANAGYIYFVIPKRWGNNGDIAHALKLRKAQVKIVGDFDFLDSEDRKARAKVSLVKVDLIHGVGRFSKKRRGRYSDNDNNPLIDPFTLWFNETFKINAKKNNGDWKEKEKQANERKENVKNALVAGNDLVGTLVELYNNELNTLISNYLKVSELDAEILKELNVDIKSVLGAFKEKIENLKALYWQEIFDNLTEITKRLTSSTRKSLLATLASNTNIDFTAGNIRSIVIWVIKNANKYFDSQMLDVYDTFTSDEGIALYKSNAHWQKDTWRYNRIKHELKERGIKYALDYRIVLHGYRGYFDKGALPESTVQQIKDIIIVASNLGYEIECDSTSFMLDTGEKGNIYFRVSKNRKLSKGQKTHLGKIEDVAYIEEDAMYQYLIDGYWRHYSCVRTDEDIFTTVKGFKNGNIHFQFSQEFIKKLNLEVGRLRGWIKSPQEATEEMDISIEEATRYWKSNFTLLPSHVPNLLPNNVQKEEEKETFAKSQQSLFEEDVFFLTEK